MIATQKDPGYYLPDYPGRLFTLPEIRAIVESNRLPGETWGAELPSQWANYIEAQIGNRAPLLEYWRQRLPRKNGTIRKTARTHPTYSWYGRFDHENEENR